MLAQGICCGVFTRGERIHGGIIIRVVMGGSHSWKVMQLQLSSEVKQMLMKNDEKQKRHGNWHRTMGNHTQTSGNF